MSKFQNNDSEYFKKRTEFADKYENNIKLWDVADNWPLYAGYVNIGRFLAIYELIKKVIDLPGHILELGTWNGTNLMYMAKVVQLLRPNTLTELYGFDSFEGLSQFSESDFSAKDSSGEYRGNEEILRDMISVYDFNNFVHLKKGNIEETLPQFLEERPELMFSLIYFDTDLYSSTKVGMELLYDRLLKGGIMVFDEYNVEKWPGETLAVNEISGDCELKTIGFTRQPTAYLQK